MAHVETVGVTDLHPVEMLQDQAQCILGDYVRNRYPRQPTRFGRLLLAIPLLRMIRSSTVEMMFFKDTVGPGTSVIRLLHDMYVADNHLYHQNSALLAKPAPTNHSSSAPLQLTASSIISSNSSIAADDVTKPVNTASQDINIVSDDNDTKLSENIASPSVEVFN